MDKNYFDVICIGGGGAGVLAAATAAEMGQKVALVTKEPPGYGNTRLAVGMIACPGVSQGDSTAEFLGDIIRSSEGLSDPHLVEALVENIPSALSLLEEKGLIIERDTEGCVSSVHQAGGHSQPRTLRNLGGGAGLGTVLRSIAYSHHVIVFNHTAVLEILKEGSSVSGAVVMDLNTGELQALTARAVILATGGCASLYYPHTTNARGAVGDGLSLGLKAGASLVDMEQVQSIPFGVTHPNSMLGALCGEPFTAGPAGVLMNGDGEVILEGDINRMTRAALVKTMMMEISRGRTNPQGGLYLDLSPNLELPRGKELYRAMEATGIFQAVYFAYGEKAYRWEDPWSVLPSMHYLMGGLRVDARGETGVPGLFAAGEIQGGVHGGNRLGSAALSEIFAFGYLAGREASVYCRKREKPAGEGIEKAISGWKKFLAGEGENEPASLRRELQECMWEKAGAVRQEDKLLQALRQLEDISSRSRSLALSGDRLCSRQLLDAVELYHMFPAAEAIIKSSLLRRESRGAHLRLDCPEQDKNLQHHITVFLSHSGSVEAQLEK